MSETKQAKPKPLRRVRKKIEIKVIDMPPNVESWLDWQQVCAALGIGRTTLKAWVADGVYPSPDYMIGNLSRWRVTTHNEWIASRPKPSGLPASPFR